jgi:hypothetical protein
MRNNHSRCIGKLPSLGTSVKRTFQDSFRTDVIATPFAKPAANFALIFPVKPSAVGFPRSYFLAIRATQSIPQANESQGIKELML